MRRRASASGRSARWSPASSRAATSRSTRARRPPQRVRRAVDGLGDLIDDYEFHYPQELNADNLDEVRDALDGHGIYCVAHRPPSRPALRARAGSSSPDAGGARRGARGARCDAADFAGALGAHFIVWPGIEGYNYPFQTPYAESGRGSSTGSARPRERCADARRHALPRAQELRAGDEDPHAQHRDDAARDPHAARAGDRQRQGQHGLAAPDHERREPRRVRGAARRRGAARAPARELGLGRRSTTTTWSARPRSWRRSSWPSSCAAPATARTASASASTSTRTPRTRSRPCARSVLQWHFIDSVAARIDDARCARRSAQGRVARLRARLRGARRRVTRRSRMRVWSASTSARPASRRSRSTPDGEVVAARRARLPALDAAARAGRSRIPRTGGARAEAALAEARRRTRRRRHRPLRPDARARRARRARRASSARRSSGTTSARRRSAPRSRSASGSSG